MKQTTFNAGLGKAIETLCKELKDRSDSMTSIGHKYDMFNTYGNDSMCQMYEGLLLSELESIQFLTLKLAELITGDSVEEEPEPEESDDVSDENTENA